MARREVATVRLLILLNIFLDGGNLWQLFSPSRGRVTVICGLSKYRKTHSSTPKDGWKVATGCHRRQKNQHFRHSSVATSFRQAKGGLLGGNLIRHCVAFWLLTGTTEGKA
jgi:hypothetical protein